MLKRTISKLPITENRIEKLIYHGLDTGSIFIVVFVQPDRRNIVVFVLYCIISAYTQDYELKLTR